MTRRQQKLLKRDIEIRKNADELPIEDLAIKYKLSITQLYRIFRNVTEKELKDYYNGE